jgi:membrane protease YdiL (CAAX protease family)
VHHHRAHLAVRSDPDPYQARARNASLVAGARRPVAALTARSEERARGWKGVVVGDPLLPPFGIWEFFGFDITGPANRDLVLFLDTRGQEFFSGNWGWFAVIVVQSVFNSVLGEDLLFRGLLLPRMRGVFGRGDFVANGLLFAFYHLHTPWAIPASLADFIYFAYPARRWQSVWMSIIVHSGQSVFVIIFILALVLS